jgi:integrase
MPVEHRLPDSKWWYGRIRENGKSVLLPLGVEVAGQPPAARTDSGDELFQKSKWRAEERLAELERALNASESIPERHIILQRFRVKRAHADQGNQATPKHLKLTELSAKWLELPTKKKRRTDSAYSAQAVRTIEAFVEFVRKRNAKAVHAFEVTDEDAAAFLKAEEARGVSPKTYNNKLTLLKSVFHRLQKRIGAANNPFGEIPSQYVETINRRPLTPAEMKAVYSMATQDPFIGPLIIVGMCSALREGDCALLAWSDIDLENGTLGMRAAKTGENVAIPILPPLRKLLEQQKAQKQRDPTFVFPQQAKLYQATPDRISSQAVKLIRQAVASVNDGRPVTKTRTRGLRKASLVDFHALRTTWITEALLAGVSPEIVIRVTGHTDMKMIRAHYNRPDQQSTSRLLTRKLTTLVNLADFEEAEAEAALAPQSLLHAALVEIENADQSGWAAARERSIKLIRKALERFNESSGLPT